MRYASDQACALDERVVHPLGRVPLVAKRKRVRFNIDEAHEREGELRERVHCARERRLDPAVRGAALHLHGGEGLGFRRERVRAKERERRVRECMARSRVALTPPPDERRLI